MCYCKVCKIFSSRNSKMCYRWRCSHHVVDCRVQWMIETELSFCDKPVTSCGFLRLRRPLIGSQSSSGSPPVSDASTPDMPSSRSRFMPLAIAPAAPKPPPPPASRFVRMCSGNSASPGRNWSDMPFESAAPGLCGVVRRSKAGDILSYLYIRHTTAACVSAAKDTFSFEFWNKE